MAKHYSSEQWADFVRGTAAEGFEQDMKRHLAAGCKKCEQAAAMWAQVAEMAGREPGYQPSASAVRIANSHFAIHRLEGKPARVPRLARLVFDSFRQPQMAGVRSAGLAPRHFVYQSGAILIDVQVARAAESAPALVTGQMLDRKSPEKAIEDMAVRLLCGGTSVTTTKTNIYGEFQLQIPTTVKDAAQLIIGEHGRFFLIPLKFADTSDSDDD